MMTDDPTPPRPFVLEVEDDDTPGADPSTAAPVPEADGLPSPRAVLAAGQVASARPSGPWRFALWAFGALFSFVLSVAAYDFAAALLASRPTWAGSRWR